MIGPFLGGAGPEAGGTPARLLRRHEHPGAHQQGWVQRYPGLYIPHVNFLIWVHAHSKQEQKRHLQPPPGFNISFTPRPLHFIIETF